MKKTTLGEAFMAWRDEIQTEVHLPLHRLYELAEAGERDLTSPAIQHLARCGECARQVGELQAAMEDAAGWDVALPKAAAAPATAPMTLATSCGKFALAMYPRGGSDEAVLTVEVSPSHQAMLEGATVTVTDRGGRVLLVAPIVLGRASARVQGLAEIDTRRLVVQAKRSTEGEA